MDMTLFDERVHANQMTADDYAFVRDFIGLTKRLMATRNLDSMALPAETPVEDWALAAMESFIAGQPDTARAICARFDEAEWGSGRSGAPDPSEFHIMWRDEHFNGEHSTEPDPNCVACPLDAFPVIEVAVMPGNATIAATD